MSQGSDIQSLQARIADLEAEVATAQKAIREFFDLFPVAMIEIELSNLRVRFTNRVARLILGYDLDDTALELSADEIVTRDEFNKIVALAADLYTRGSGPDGAYTRTGLQDVYETVGRRRDGSTFPVEFQAMFILNPDGIPVASRIVFRDISERKAVEADRERLLIELQDALASVRTLQGLLPICAWCKKVRDDSGYWNELESYVRRHSDAEFSHGICPDCAARVEQRQDGRRKPDR
jgi:PAS domain S-box-containing protein